MGRKVYSATQFFNELNLLELKLEALDSLVDYFVISESTKTHAGNPKPLYYLENKEKFKKYHHKIIHQIINDTPNNYAELMAMKPKNDLHEKVINAVKNAYWLDLNKEVYFIRDDYEKEAVVMGIKDLSDDDIVLVGDFDEIPRPEVLKKTIEYFDYSEVHHFKQEMFYVYLNLHKVNEPWVGVMALSGKKALMESFGEHRQFKKGIHLNNGGWHFTYLGNAEKIKQKIQSYSHQEFNLPQVTDNIQYRIDHVGEFGQDVLGRPSHFVVRDINDGTFPEYLVNNQEKYKDLIK